MKNICIIANSPFTVLNFRKELIKKLLARGCKISVFIPDNCILVDVNAMIKEFSKLGVSVNYIPLSRSGLNPISDFKLCYMIYRLLKKEKADIVLNYTIKATIYGSIAAHLAKVKLIASNITGLGFVFTSKTWKAKLLLIIVKLQYKLALKLNKVVFFQNIDDKNLFEKETLIGTSKACLLAGSGVDTDFYSPQKVDEKRNDINFLFVGRLLKEKGVSELIKATKRLKQKHSEIKVTIVGGFDSNPSSINKEAIDKFMKDGIIDYLGVISDKLELKRIYSQHDVFVLPSYREGTPRSTLEALSMGLPVLTTDVPGCRTTVIDGVNGKLVPAENCQALFEGMLYFIENKEVLIEYGENSRKLAVDKFDVNIVNSKIIKNILA